MSNKVTQWWHDHETVLVKIIRWLVFGVLSSLLPFLLVLARYWIIDHEVVELDYLLDLLLITFAVAVNVLSLSTDREKKVSHGAKLLSGIFPCIAMLFCVAMYFSFFEQSVLNSKLLEQYTAISNTFVDGSVNEDTLQQLSGMKYWIDEIGPKTEKLTIFIRISAVGLIVNAVIGVILEILDSQGQKAGKIK